MIFVGRFLKFLVFEEILEKFFFDLLGRYILICFMGNGFLFFDWVL